MHVLQVATDKNTIKIRHESTLDKMYIQLRAPTRHEFCPSGNLVVKTKKKKSGKGAHVIKHTRYRNTKTTSSQDNTSRQRPRKEHTLTRSQLQKQVLTIEKETLSDNDIFQEIPILNKSLTPNTYSSIKKTPDTTYHSSFHDNNDTIQTIEALDNEKVLWDEIGYKEKQINKSNLNLDSTIDEAHVSSENSVKTPSMKYHSTKSMVLNNEHSSKDNIDEKEHSNESVTIKSTNLTSDWRPLINETTDIVVNTGVVRCIISSPSQDNQKKKDETVPITRKGKKRNIIYSGHSQQHEPTIVHKRVTRSATNKLLLEQQASLITKDDIHKQIQMGYNYRIKKL